MMPLVWSGRDAFDSTGARVATVARFRDPILGEGGLAGQSQPFWNAFVHHEYVLVDDAPGRWATEAQARAAADAAYASCPEPPVAQHPPGPDIAEGRPSLPIRIAGHLVALVRAVVGALRPW